MTILLFRPIIAVHDDRKCVLHPFETSEDRDFLLGAFDYSECIQIQGCNAATLEGKLPFILPSETDILVDRDIVQQNGVLSRRPDPEQISWDDQVFPGDRVEFRAQLSGPSDMPNDGDSASNIFRREGSVWHLRFTESSNVEEAYLPDLKGLRHISVLLQRPEELIDSIDIDPRKMFTGADERSFHPMIDDQARSALLARIQELEDRIEIAEDTGNAERLSEFQQELRALQEQEKKALNWKGKARPLGNSEAVKASDRVKRNLGTAFARLGEKMPQLAHFFQTSIRPNGTGYMYRPSFRIEWKF